MKSSLPIGIPIVCSLASLILAFLVVFAGKNPGFMEDSHIIMLNTSELGKNLVPTPTSGGSDPSSTGGDCGLPGVFGEICGSATSEAASVVSKAADVLGDIEDDIADKLAEKLGIHEFYSLHVMDICEGDFTPNATTPGAGFNVTNCTKPLDKDGYNVTAHFDVQLSAGPLNLNLADLGFTKDLQEQFDKIPRLLLALAVIYFFAIGFIAVSLFAAVAALVLPSKKRREMSLVNLTLACLASLVLLIGNLLTTVGAKTAVDKINDLGDDIGLHAVSGNKFTGMSWAAFALMAIATGTWGFLFHDSRYEGRRGGLREKHSGY